MANNYKRHLHNECYHCESKQEVPGNRHIQCVNPDPNMKGNPHGIKNGWFFYPRLFDPVWKQELCSNFKLHTAVSNAVSGAVSNENKEHTS